MPPVLTSRLSLSKPDPADLYNVSHHNGNMDKLDVAAGTIICTSTTRPGTPFVGMTIYETDTGHTLVRTSTPAWVRTSPGLIAGNVYAVANATLTTMVNNTTEQLTGMSVPSATYLTGRVYKVTAVAEYDNVAAGRLLFKLRTDTISGTQWGARQGPGQVSATIREHVQVMGIIEPLADFTGTIVLTATRGAANATVPRFYKSTTTKPFIVTELIGASSLLTAV